MLPYKLLIFDWDGTLADSAAQIVGAMQGAIGALGLPPREDAAIRDLIGLSLSDGMQRLYPQLDTADLLRLLDGYRQHFVGSGHNEAPLFRGTLMALQELYGQGYRLAVATGKSRPGLRRSLEHHQLLKPLFSITRTADETAPKPDPRMLGEILEEEQIDAGDALMIGDTEYDAEMARAIGMPMLGVACGVHEPGRLRAAGALALIEQVRELPAWLVSRQGIA